MSAVRMQRAEMQCYYLLPVQAGACSKIMRSGDVSLRNTSEACNLADGENAQNVFLIVCDNRSVHGVCSL